MEQTDGMLIGEFQKNSREKVFVKLMKYNGHPMLDIRVHVESAQGEWIPIKKGIQIPVRLFPELKKLIAAAAEVVEEQSQDGSGKEAA